MSDAPEDEYPEWVLDPDDPSHEDRETLAKEIAAWQANLEDIRDSVTEYVSLLPAAALRASHAIMGDLKETLEVTVENHERALTDLTEDYGWTGKDIAATLGVTHEEGERLLTELDRTDTISGALYQALWNDYEAAVAEDAARQITKNNSVAPSNEADIEGNE